MESRLSFCDKSGSLPLASSIDYQSYFLACGYATPISHQKYFRANRLNLKDSSLRGVANAEAIKKTKSARSANPCKSFCYFLLLQKVESFLSPWTLNRQARLFWIRFWDIDFYCSLNLRDLDTEATVSPQYDEVFNFFGLARNRFAILANYDIAFALTFIPK